MPDLVALIEQGAANPWIYLPAALILGALHALEPGHSKSLMAAFIVAIKGSIGDAVLLGLSAAAGHTIVVWVIALVGLSLGDKLVLDKAEPWLVLISGVLIVALSSRLIWSVAGRSAGRAHDHDHDHDHHHDEPHAHSHDDEDDAHAAAHARAIETRFVGRGNVSRFDIVWFGFTGGLLPCPAAVAVLLVCLQVKALSLGAAMVAAFSVGLAITLVAVGVAAAWGTRQAAKSWSGFEVWANRLPYVSGALVLIMGLAISAKGIWQIVTAGQA
ncbi:MAG: nickel/cobalt efflux transporter [Ancalomicrobiaceae bacterium]|nr:nickel/cobalt efflux transporter [Ancalomicrobiaceae bacterium]